MFDSEKAKHEDLPFFDVMSPEFFRDPEQATRQLRHKHRIARSQVGLEVLGFPESVQMLRDDRITLNFETQMKMLGLPSGLAYAHMTRQPGNLEGDAHKRVRRLIMPVFSVSAMNRLRTPTRAIFASLLDAVWADGECEFVSQVSDPFPSRVLCQFLNVPEVDASFLARVSGSIMKVFWINPAHHAEIESAFKEFNDYVLVLIERRRREPGDDFISGLIRAEEEGSRLSTQEMVDLVKVSLWASVDNITHTLNIMMTLFAEHPAQWDLLRARPELIPGAVEECMRYRPRVIRLFTYARQDIEVAGVDVPAGSWVSSVIAAANRDERVFPDPDRIDITRKPNPVNLNYGTGRHTCAGLHLAQIQLQEALATIAQRCKGIEITGEVATQGSLQMYGIQRLPLRFVHA